MRRKRELVCLLLGAFGAACGAEFPNEPTGTLTIQVRPGSADTLMVRDTANLAIDIGDSRGETITGIQVDWQSSDATMLELRRLPPASQTPKDSLAAQLTIQAIAHARGKAVVTVAIDRAGFERTELKDTVTILERWLSISAGVSHTCAIAADSTAYCWGTGIDGALGNGRPLDSNAPVKVLGSGDLRFVSISAGDGNSCGIIVEAVAYCWGSGKDGRLGNNDPAQLDQFLPVPVSGGTQFIGIAAGATTCAVASVGTAWCWGDDREKQLGVQAPLNLPLDCGGFCSFRPRTVASMFGARTFQEVDVGIHHTCGASVTQTFCWGSGVVVPVTLQNVYLLGDSTIFSSDTAVVLSSGALRLISVGGEHACGLVLGVSAKCWGRNDRGQLGVGSTAAQVIPATVAGAIVFGSITAGGEHSCGLDGNGTPYCWGDNSSGQLGATTTGTCTTVNQSGIPITVPCSTVPVRAAGSLEFALLSAGLSHTCGVAIDGAAYCWGEGVGGKLGNNAVANSPTAVRVTEPK